MIQTTSDPSTRNVDADNPPRTNGAPGPSGQVPEVDPQEAQRVQQWHRDIAETRAFDEAARRIYAMDRRYARGDTRAIVQHSLIQPYIDILVAFLVARNPDFDCLAADRVVGPDTEINDAHGETMGIIISYLLRSARIRRVAEKVVRSALSVGIGWFKAVWFEQFETDPVISRSLKTAQDNIAQLEAQREKIAEGDVGDMDAELAKLRDLKSSLLERVEQIALQGMSLVSVRPEDMTVSMEVENVIDSEEACWNAQRYFIHVDRGAAMFPRIPQSLLAGATTYSPRKPVDRKSSQDNGALVDFNAEDADQFTKGGVGGSTSKYLACHEVWDGETNKFFTVIEGIGDRYAREPMVAPAPTKRFYPFFALSFTEVDGERHPQSLIQRSYKMQDEIDRTLNQMVEHRRRIKPQVFFDASMVTKAQARRFSRDSVTGEYVAMALVGDPAKRDLRRMMVPKTYAAIDPALYDIALYIRCMETTWGIQEAMTGSVQVAKTATEADIQQAGTQAKSGYKRDVLEKLMTGIAAYTAENASYKLTVEDARAIAGPAALWIQLESPDELDQLLSIEVRAGSTGKPDSVARREAFMALSAQMEKLILAIADLRQSNSLEIADCLEALLMEFSDRLGERMDAKKFIPQPPAAAIKDPITGMPMTNAGVQQQAQAARGAAQAPPGAPEGERPVGGTRPDDAAQEMAAPLAVPA